MAQEAGTWSTSPKSEFKWVNVTKEAEDAYDLSRERKSVLDKPIGTVATIAHLMKSALGSGILSGHVAYMKAGYMVAIPVTFLLALYLFYCLYILGRSSQMLCKRTGRPIMSYAELGEAAMALYPNAKVQKCCKAFRYYIDGLIMIELFGACATYQLIIAKTIKQLVENTQETSVEPQIAGYPGVRVYMAAIIIPCILICLLRHLQWLAPFSIVANVLIGFCVCVTIYYATQNNPKFENLVSATDITGVFELMGMIVFGMSCASQIISVENNMQNPNKYTLALSCGMVLIVGCVLNASFFGYVAYLDKCDAPITINFPMTIFPKVLKGVVAVMIYVTHALNYWVPLVRLYSYLQRCHKREHVVKWEYFYRALIVIIIAIIGIAFPDITALMGFLGSFSLSNIAFLFPLTIDLLVTWHRPGLGACYWRLARNILLLAIGVLLWACGSVISFRGLLKAFKK